MKKLQYIFEILVIFIGLPILMYYNAIPLPRLLVLLSVFILTLIISINQKYLTKSSFNLRVADKKYIIFSSLAYLGTFCLLVAYLHFFRADLLFNIIRHKPKLIFLIIVFYPLVSAFPQEVIYRTFFIKRYKSLFNTKWQMLLVNTLLFSFLHIIYDNWYAIILTLVGGFIMTYNYYRNKSLMLVTIEHSIFGLIVFISGMGKFFYE